MIAVYLALIESESEKNKFEQVYERYKGLMLSRAYEILHDYSLAEDAVHNAFIRILKNLGKLDSADSPRTKGFVMIVLENVCKTMYAKQSRQQIIELSEELPSQAFTTEAVEASLTAEYIAEKIDLLPQKYREVVLLRFLHDLSDKEIASALGISHSAVRKRLERARSLLKDLLGDDLYG